VQGGPDAERQPTAAGRCASCGAALDASFRHCPSCGHPAAQAALDVDIAGWVKAGWNLFVNNIGLAIAIPLVLIAPVVAVGIFGYAGFIALCFLGEAESRAATVGLIVLGAALGLVFLVLGLLAPALQAGIYACFLDGIRTGRLRATNLTAGFRQWWACTWVFWLLTAASSVCMPFVLILIGIPALYAVTALLWLSLFHIVDRRQGGVEALSFAWEAMRGRFWMVLLFTFLMHTLKNAGASAMYVGMLITVPICVAALAAGYHAMSGRQEPPAAS